ncbi:hypothetical protein Mal48_10400 [Thalassoglobus polymorphus]|uniref:Uncharacterized protein n=1 Tax=Thalassoglobus polymorphus TaxID=2527994 RepID=A0A517QJM9_9PLAN|nr:hypothetical protein Mal48_10400 [Thalassoglobus polymorphus]
MKTEGCFQRTIGDTLLYNRKETTGNQQSAASSRWFRNVYCGHVEHQQAYLRRMPARTALENQFQKS